ncbi:MAG: OmpH family outer membrane protein [Bacteroidota bacterium]|nr:OmpH family outer membrane protein [Bacteroidota bacterium]
MKKIIFASAFLILLASCNKSTTATGAATTEQSTNNIVYLDSSKLLKEYKEAQDIEAKYKAKSEQMSKDFESKLNKFKADVEFFQKNAQSKGMQWAQQTGAALEEREQRLAYAQQSMVQQLQSESGAEMDSLVKQIKDFIKEFGKEKGYSYILSTSDVASTVLYAKDGQEITDELIKLLNEKYQNKLANKDEIKIEKDSTSTKK